MVNKGSVLARGRTWSSTFAGSCAIRHTPRTIAVSIPARTRTGIRTFGGSDVVRYTTRMTRPADYRAAAGAEGVEASARALEARCSPGSTLLYSVFSFQCSVF